MKSRSVRSGRWGVSAAVAAILAGTALLSAAFLLMKSQPAALPGVAAVVERYTSAPATPIRSGAPRHNGATPGAEAQLRQVLYRLEAREIPAALEEVDRLIAEHPNFRLAHLVRGDLLLARARPIRTLGNIDDVAPERLALLRAEALARLKAYREQPDPELVPAYLLQLTSAQSHAIVVDARRSRVYVYQNSKGTLRLVEHYYTSLGRQGIQKVREGDQKTPIGVYHITSRIPGSRLPDLYGWGAFPINYPNEWDRLHGRTGHGIWLHGVPSENYARAPWASDGCIVLANPEIEQLARRVQIGVTPVIISRELEWVRPEALRAERESFLKHLEAWRRDWESLDTDRYLAHYAQTFRSADMNRAMWDAHKRRVGAGRKSIKVALSEVSVLRVPGERNLLQVTFDQDYRSEAYAERMRKRQYWVLERGVWKITYEAPVSKMPERLPESFPG